MYSQTVIVFVNCNYFFVKIYIIIYFEIILKINQILSCLFQKLIQRDASWITCQPQRYAPFCVWRARRHWFTRAPNGSGLHSAA